MVHCMDTYTSYSLCVTSVRRLFLFFYVQTCIIETNIQVTQPPITVFIMLNVQR